MACRDIPTVSFVLNRPVVLEPAMRKRVDPDDGLDARRCQDEPKRWGTRVRMLGAEHRERARRDCLSSPRRDRRRGLVRPSTRIAGESSDSDLTSGAVSFLIAEKCQRIIDGLGLVDLGCTPIVETNGSRISVMPNHPLRGGDCSSTIGLDSRAVSMTTWSCRRGTPS